MNHDPYAPPRIWELGDPEWYHRKRRNVEHGAQSQKTAPGDCQNSSNSTKDLCIVLNVNYTTVFQRADSAAGPLSYSLCGPVLHPFDSCFPVCETEGPFTPALRAIAGVK